MEGKPKQIFKNNIKYDVIQQSSERDDPKSIDFGVKNKWNWNWLTEKDFSDQEDFLSDYIVKISKPGVVCCVYCDVDIVYGSSGKPNLKKHAQRNDKHAQQRQIRATNTSLPKAFFEPNDSQSLEQTCSLPYGSPPNVHNNELCKKGKIAVPKPEVSIVDRKCIMEAHLLSFVCEHNLPVYLTSKLLQLCKDVNRDPKVLNEINLSPGSATYKIVDGLGHFYNKAVICNLRKKPFSINIDECTESSGMKVFTILVSYFDDELGKSTVHYYKSVECIEISAELLTDAILKAFSEDEIPLENLISDLSDSASYMRGEKSGIEKR